MKDTARDHHHSNHRGRATPKRPTLRFLTSTVSAFYFQSLSSWPGPVRKEGWPRKKKIEHVQDKGRKKKLNLTWIGPPPDDTRHALLFPGDRRRPTLAAFLCLVFTVRPCIPAEVTAFDASEDGRMCYLCHIQQQVGPSSQKQENTATRQLPPHVTHRMRTRSSPANND